MCLKSYFRINFIVVDEHRYLISNPKRILVTNENVLHCRGDGIFIFYIDMSVYFVLNSVPNTS